MKTPAAVLFDCDGVIVDSEPITNQILQDNLAARGLSLELDQIVHLFVGGTMQAVGEKAAGLGAKIEDGWLDRIYEQMFARLAQHTPLISGIVDLLDKLDSNDISYAVGSNGPVEKMKATIGQYPELWGRLEKHLYSSHTHAKPKPAPDLYLFAARQLGVDPQNCVVVEDSPAGATAAKNAGMMCFGLAEHDDGKRLADVGARVIHGLAEIPDLVGL